MFWLLIVPNMGIVSTSVLF